MRIRRRLKRSSSRAESLKEKEARSQEARSQNRESHSGFWLLSLNEKVFQRIRIDNLRRPDRSELNVFVGTSGRSVLNLLSPVHSQGRVDRRDEVIDHGLLLGLPAGIDAFAGHLVCCPEYLLAFNASAHQRRGEHLVVVVP